MENSQQVVLYELMLNSSFKKKVEEKERKEKKTCGTKKKKKRVRAGHIFYSSGKVVSLNGKKYIKWKEEKIENPGLKMNKMSYMDN